MKKGVIGLAVFIFCFSFISALPFLFYQSPTPGDGASITDFGSFEINVSLSNITGLSSIVFNFANTNYTLYNESLVLAMNFENRSSLGESNTRVLDLSIYENNGTIDDANLTSGKYGNAYGFDGNDSITISGDDELNLTDDFTLSAWVNLEEFDIVDFSFGGEHYCFVLSNGDAMCAGKNNYGQLGDNTGTTSNTPVVVYGGWNFTDVELSLESSCGLLTNGSIVCWGRDNSDQLGCSNCGDQDAPVLVQSDLNFTNIYAGDSFYMSILTNGSLVVWGEGSTGRLASGATTDISVPTITTDHNFSVIAPGEVHACGILTNGSALCWGGNNEGQLGNGSYSEGDYSLVPVFVEGDYNFSLLASGEDQSCGQLVNGTVLCWGENKEYQLGNGLTISSASPVHISNGDSFNNFISLDMTKHISCGLLANGSVACWGWNFRTFGTSEEDTYPTPTFFPRYSDITQIYGAQQDNMFCFNSSSRGISCFGSVYLFDSLSGTDALVYYPQKSIFPSEFDSPLKKFVSSFFYSCMLLENNSLYCKGYSILGGVGVVGSSSHYNPILEGEEFLDVSISSYSSCGVLINGSGLCWGDNSGGVFGNGSIGAVSFDPVPIRGDFNFSIIEVGPYNAACGILANGTVVCWGRNEDGQIGNGTVGGTVDTPAFVSVDFNFSNLSFGESHVCGILTNGSVMCWGDNAYGQIGNGTTGGDADTPVFVEGDYNFSDIASSKRHTCGLLVNGSALCWGQDALGQLGRGGAGSSDTPVPVSGDYNYSAIECDLFMTAGLLANGSVVLWGYDIIGANFGNGNAVNTLSNVPSFVSLPEGVNFSEPLVYDLYSRGVFVNSTSGDYYAWGENSYDKLNVWNGDFGGLFNLYRGILVGKSTRYFQISSTISDNARVFVSDFPFDLDLNPGWNHVAVTRDSNSVKVYLNGVLNNSFNQKVFMYDNGAENLFIGNDSNATIDEVRIWNRSLSASEVSQVYKSNIEKVNATSWNFYSNQTALTPGDYYYYLFAIDAHSSYKILTRLFRVIAAVTSSTDDTSSGGITISEERLEEGYTKIFVAGQSSSLSVGSKTYITKVNSVSKESVSVSVGSKSVDVKVGTSEKVDLDSDGVYDLEIIVHSVDSSGNANLEFKAISEAVLSEVQEEVSEEAITEEEKPLADKTSNWYLKILSVVALIIVLGIVLEKVFKNKFKKKHKRKKRK